MINHMADQPEYPYFKRKLFEYVQSGECPPERYADIVDKYSYINNLNPEYGGMFSSAYKKIDSAKADRNRKLLGMPSFKHAAKLRYDYFKD